MVVEVVGGVGAVAGVVDKVGIELVENPKSLN